MCGSQPTNQGKEAGDLFAAPAEHRNEIQGSVFGPAVQARDIHGGVHVYPPAPAVQIPSQLPPAVHLSGRSRDIAAIDAARASGAVVISGPPGIGKTSLAVCWGHIRAAEFPDGQLFADLRGHVRDGPAAPGEVLGRFLRALGVAPDTLPAELAERTALYRSVTSRRRVVVVLDDAISAAQVIPLLPASAESMALITSRWRLASLVAQGVRNIQVGRLEPDAALDLLGRALGAERVACEPGAARELVHLCACFPLAVCIAAARLAVRPRWPISEMASALRQEQRRLGALALGEDMAIRAALDLSYRALQAEAARLYRIMGLFPGGSFDGRLAAAAAEISLETARHLLGVLVDANLLDDAADGRYQYHDLIRLHARGMAEQEEPGPEGEGAIRRMLDWYLAAVTEAGQMAAPYRRGQPRDVDREPAEPAPFTGPAAALDWLECELPDLLAVVRFAADHGFPVLAWQTIDAMWPLFLHRGHYRERLEFDRTGLAAARSCGDVTGEAKMLGRLGLALITLNRLDEAAECFNQALAIWRGLGNDYRLASSLRRLGLVERARGHNEAAIGLFTQALDAYRQLPEPRATALTHNDIGAALIDIDRPAEAIMHLDRARELFAGVPDPYNQARVLAGLGLAQERSGDRGAAAGTLEQALRAMRRVQSSPGEADVLRLLGDLAERGGQPREARRRYEAALAIFTRLDAPAAALLRDRLARLNQAE
jgi:tetratricopeptide (TPR) repeat protein